MNAKTNGRKKSYKVTFYDMLQCKYIQKANYQNIDGLIKKKETYQQLIVLGNGHSGVLLFNWKFPRVM